MWKMWTFGLGGENYPNYITKVLLDSFLTAKIRYYSSTDWQWRFAQIFDLGVIPDVDLTNQEISNVESFVKHHKSKIPLYEE